MAKFYAVRAGRARRVCATWAEAEALVRGYPRAEFRGFPTRAAAEAYLAAPAPAAPAPAAVAYADGSARAGRGAFGFVIFGPGGARFEGAGPVPGPATSDRAELFAVGAAAAEARRLRAAGRLPPGPLEVRTDSAYVARTFGGWLAEWKARSGLAPPPGAGREFWEARPEALRRAGGGPPAHAALVLAVDRALAEAEATVAHVRGHAGDPGNCRADALARGALGLARGAAPAAEAGPSP